MLGRLGEEAIGAGAIARGEWRILGNGAAIGEWGVTSAAIQT